MKYDVVIGLEVHSELKTQTKAFCGCKNEFGSMPNTNCCPVCLGLPGALPVVNKKSVEYAIKAGLAFNCSISNYTVFERKNYFYPDLSKAYQISQLEFPLCENGYVELLLEENNKKIRLNRIHMEEDAGKNLHDDFTNSSLVDFNRCGVPLIEIVTEPDLSSSDEAVEFLNQVKETLVYIEVSDGKMQEGSLRCDVNVSLKPKGSETLGNRTEMKNLNSFKAVKRAIEYEIKRQEKLLDDNKTIAQETRRWDDIEGKSYSLRTKEESQDYRYFPDKDLLPITVEDSYVEEVKSILPKLPNERRKEYTTNLNLPDYDAKVLTQNKEVANYFENCLQILNEPKRVSNFIMSHVLRLLKLENEEENNKINVTEKQLCDIINMAKAGEISSSGAKVLFEKCWETQKDPKVLCEDLGLKQVSDESELENIIKNIIKENPQAVTDYEGGNKRALTFFIGQVMKATKGKANPAVVNKILKEQLNR